MKIFGVSLMTILLLLIAYALGASFPGPVNAIKAKL
jgi:hypothetical protein